MTTIATNIPARRPSLLAQLTLALTVWRERQALKRLDATALEDIGLSRKDALVEAYRGLSQLPAHRAC
ncbi:MAG: DUF1127 domain-containing protein [Rhodobacteraceae bacterium]|nr:DUF1127 domain-containing protein [Paracoccaceae bacterium]